MPRTIDGTGASCNEREPGLGPADHLNGTQDDRQQIRTTSFMIDSLRRLDDIANADT
ncbi:MAG: hypothetical protein VB142_07395 [Burkholderia sp.]